MNELSSFVYGLRLIERGVLAGRKLCAVLNLPFVLSKLAFHQQENKLLIAATSTGEKTMNDAAKGIRQLKNSIHDTVNCGVSMNILFMLDGNVRKKIQLYSFSGNERSFVLGVFLERAWLNVFGWVYGLEPR
ncbi:hypothetical protein TNIN_7461 [Trichonephila inaurata madagascariensis]|uniref:Uncharacterized protein n=1 Tax=Trichonephila inaurata madagascariensis TaxID=2747483 RepID=A0A8X6XIF0_9ARAC|nr:hypothetical protein TNIN_7461 [Trichonephila inaurata madagascariensis]